MNAYLVYGQYTKSEYVAGYWCDVDTLAYEIVYANDEEYALARFERRYYPGLTESPQVCLLSKATDRKRRGFAGIGDKLWEQAYAVIDGE